MLKERHTGRSECFPPSSVALVNEGTDRSTRYHRLMKERGVDFILCPTYVGVAAELGTPQYWSYTAIWNILDQPAVIFPTGLKADPALDHVEADYTPRSPTDEREYKKCECLMLCDFVLVADNMLIFVSTSQTSQIPSPELPLQCSLLESISGTRKL